MGLTLIALFLLPLIVTGQMFPVITYHSRTTNSGYSGTKSESFEEYSHPGVPGHYYSRNVYQNFDSKIDTDPAHLYPFPAEKETTHIGNVRYSYNEQFNAVSNNDRFDNMLKGLTLYNLDRNYHSHRSERQYISFPREICKLVISEDSSYEEQCIDCNVMSSFIWEDMTSATQDEQHVVKKAVNEIINSVSTVTKKSATVDDALKDSSVAVSPAMTCRVIRIFGATTIMRKGVDCGILQEYARNSSQRSVEHSLTIKMILFNFLIIYLVRY